MSGKITVEPATGEDGNYTPAFLSALRGEPAGQACGESDGTHACTITPGDHNPASNHPDGPVWHQSADGFRWAAPIGDAEAAAAAQAMEG